MTTQQNQNQPDQKQQGDQNQKSGQQSQAPSPDNKQPDQEDARPEVTAAATNGDPARCRVIGRRDHSQRGERHEARFQRPKHSPIQEARERHAHRG